MDRDEILARSFEEQRGHLRAVAYRTLGSLSEADDAVQEAWLRLSAAGTSGVENLPGWMTTIVARVSLNLLRSRATRREDALDTHVPDPVLDGLDGSDPEHEALLADSVGLALMVVLDTLPPAERLAFVLHDMFAVPFDDIAPIVDRSVAATRQLASRARRRVRGAATPDAELARPLEVVDAWRGASRGGDFEALLALLDPDVVLRVDYGAVSAGTSRLVLGARAVAERATVFARFGRSARPVLVNGALGLLTTSEGQVFSLMALTITDGRIVEINILADPTRLPALVPPVLVPPSP
jgi:RNA polymerase sigma factor (sigma-70 family)